MGLWGFLKGRGKPLFGPCENAEVTSDALRRELTALGLDFGGMLISVDGDTVRLGGQAVCQATKERVILAVGNVVGVAAVVEDVPSETEPVFHTVVPGDTLRRIAAIKLGSAARFTELFEANKPLLAHPDDINWGYVLRLPQT